MSDRTPPTTTPPFSGSGSAPHRMPGREAIEWIKRYRAIAGVTLREAKDAYDAGRPMPEAPDAVADAQRFARQRALEAAAPEMFDALEFARTVLAGRPDRSLADDLAVKRIDAALSRAGASS